MTSCAIIAGSFMVPPLKNLLYLSFPKYSLLTESKFKFMAKNRIVLNVAKLDRLKNKEKLQF